MGDTYIPVLHPIVMFKHMSGGSKEFAGLLGVFFRREREREMDG